LEEGGNSLRNHMHENNKPGRLYTIYLNKGRKWKKIGEFCTVCGFHIDRELLEKNTSSLSTGNPLKFSFNGLVSKKPKTT
jgi:uncharacterized Fe-S cluster-containing MiaB family protein